MDERAARAQAVVAGVCAQALRDAGARGLIVLEDWTPEGELVYEWLVRGLGEDRVWRAASVEGNVHDDAAAWRDGADDRPLLAHPANRTALLLGGRLPRADLFPLGDLWASQVESLTGNWSAPVQVQDAVRRAGGVAVVDDALGRLLDGRWDPDGAMQALDATAAGQLRELLRRGRYSRLRPRLVPKLSARTLGIDLYD